MNKNQDDVKVGQINWQSKMKAMGSQQSERVQINLNKLCTGTSSMPYR